MSNWRWIIALDNNVFMSVPCHGMYWHVRLDVVSSCSYSPLLLFLILLPIFILFLINLPLPPILLPPLFLVLFLLVLLFCLFLPLLLSILLIFSCHSLSSSPLLLFLSIFFFPSSLLLHFFFQLSFILLIRLSSTFWAIFWLSNKTHWGLQCKIELLTRLSITVYWKHGETPPSMACFPPCDCLLVLSLPKCLSSHWVLCNPSTHYITTSPLHIVTRVITPARVPVGHSSVTVTASLSPGLTGKVLKDIH